MNAKISKASTLADLLGAIRSDTNLPGWKRNQTASHLRTFGRVQGRTLEELPADLNAYRKFLKEFHPIKAGLQKRHWDNVKTGVLFAFQHCGLRVLPGRSIANMTQEWKKLYGLLENDHQKAGISRFARFCSSRNISPQEVSDVVMEDYEEVLREESFAKEPERQHRRCAQTWNRMAKNEPSLPRIFLTVPDRRTRVTLPWSEFPSSIQEEIERFLSDCANPDPFSDLGPRRALAAETIRGRRYQFLCYLSALVLTGSQAGDLKCLVDALDIEKYKRGLRYLNEHYTQTKTTSRMDPYRRRSPKTRCISYSKRNPCLRGHRICGRANT